MKFVMWYQTDKFDFNQIALQNLDKWKSSRRKRLQNTVESIIQIKKNEQEDEMNRMRRKSKTFSQMQEDK